MGGYDRPVTVDTRRPAEIFGNLDNYRLPDLENEIAAQQPAAEPLPIPTVQAERDALANAQRNRRSTETQLFIVRRLGVAGIGGAQENAGNAEQRGRHAEVAVVALEAFLDRTRTAPAGAHAWQTERALAQSLLGFAHLQTAGITQFTPENVQAAINGGGDNATRARNALAAFETSRASIERIIAAYNAIKPPPQDLAARVAELNAVLTAMPQVERGRDGQLRLTAAANPSALIQITLRRNDPPSTLVQGGRW